MLGEQDYLSKEPVNSGEPVESGKPHADLGPLIIRNVRYGDLVLRADPPIHLDLRSDATGKLITAEFPALAIDIFAPTIEKLLVGLSEQVAMLWAEFAMEDDLALDGMSVKLKRTLLGAFREISPARKDDPCPPQ